MGTGKIAASAHRRDDEVARWRPLELVGGTVQDREAAVRYADTLSSVLVILVKTADSE